MVFLIVKKYEIKLYSKLFCDECDVFSREMCSVMYEKSL